MLLIPLILCSLFGQQTFAFLKVYSTTKTHTSPKSLKKCRITFSILTYFNTALMRHFLAVLALCVPLKAFLRVSVSLRRLNIWIYGQQVFMSSASRRALRVT